MNTDSKFRDMCAYGTEGNYMEYAEDGTVQKLRDDWNWPSYTQASSSSCLLRRMAIRMHGIR